MPVLFVTSLRRGSSSGSWALQTGAERLCKRSLSVAHSVLRGRGQLGSVSSSCCAMCCLNVFVAQGAVCGTRI